MFILWQWWVGKKPGKEHSASVGQWLQIAERGTNVAVCGHSGNEVRAVCEYDRGRGLEGDEGTERARGA